MWKNLSTVKLVLLRPRRREELERWVPSQIKETSWQKPEELRESSLYIEEPSHRISVAAFSEIGVLWVQTQNSEPAETMWPIAPASEMITRIANT